MKLYFDGHNCYDVKARSTEWKMFNKNIEKC